MKYKLMKKFSEICNGVDNEVSVLKVEGYSYDMEGGRARQDKYIIEKSVFINRNGNRIKKHFDICTKEVEEKNESGRKIKKIVFDEEEMKLYYPDSFCLISLMNCAKDYIDCL